VELERSVLLPYSAHDIFDLIEAAEHYPQFLPWCTGVTILERSDDWVAARLDFSYLRLRFGFQTRNPKRRPEWLRVQLVEGPFKHFRGDWADRLQRLPRQHHDHVRGRRRLLRQPGRTRGGLRGPGDGGRLRQARRCHLDHA
jgi:ribosome-associated toxin RatA of RatAB toxin-antitoxin module